ncbi:RE2 [Symbiodinium sp. CCMP2456]|nr:RE2 [Symbiodinium sp. CCMP2456]
MSGATEVSGTVVTRTKDGIPTWSGEAGSFVQYEEAALLWEQSLTWEKRYTAGPKLVQELTGAARRFVTGQGAGWVAYRGGVTVLMDHLRRALGKPRVNEVTDLLATYFKGTRRRANESMNEYITRKSEAYMRASQALKRVQPYYDKTGPQTWSEPWNPSRRSSWDGHGSAWGRQWTPASETTLQEDTEASTEAPRDADGNATEEWQTRWRPWGTYHQGGWNSWSWHGGWDSGYQWSQTSASSTSGSEAMAMGSELLPSFIQGWYLLADSSLDHAERNIILTALGGDFAPQRVAQELRNQFPEGEVRRRDQRRHQSYMGENVDESADDETAENHGFTLQELTDGGMTEEGIALVVDYEETAREAMAAMYQAKRTLKEARQKQHSVKQSRRYYTSGSGSASSAPRPRDDSNIDCLRCGKKGHRAANCPIKPLASQGEAHAATNQDDGGLQQAPFVCFQDLAENNREPHMNGFAQDLHDEQTEAALSAEVPGDGLSTWEAVKQGMCVVDGGATQTVGSVTAVEAILQQNMKKHGKNGLTAVSTKDPPTFSFGNSTENKCLSTAVLKVTAGGSPGALQVHTLDYGQSPVLLSVEALRNLGAIIDFSADLAVFRKLDDSRVIKLARGKSGHQLLPLTEDWMTNATKSARCEGYVQDLGSRQETLDGTEDASGAVERVADTVKSSAGYQAQNLVPIAFPLACHNMDRMSKAELVLHLRSMGEEPPASWTRMELRQRLSDMADHGEVMITTAKKGKTALQTAVAELNRASRKKSELIEYAVKNHSVKVGSNDTIAIIQKNCMTLLIQTIEGEDDDLMGFGKHSERTYLQVLESDGQYCDWARTTAREGDCSIYLKRFVNWMEHRRPADTKKKIIMAKKKTSKMGAGYPEPELAPTPKAKTMMTSSAASSSEDAVLQLTEMVATLAAEVKSLKEDKGEKPRKMTARPDEEMPMKGLVGVSRVQLLEVTSDSDSLLTNMLVARCPTNYQHARLVLDALSWEGDGDDVLKVEGRVSVREGSEGEVLSGKEYDIWRKGLVFPPKAHWKIGTCENAVKGVKEVMSKLCHADPDLSVQEALAEAVVAFNQKDLIRGFSPAQHLLGQAPDETGRFTIGCDRVPPGMQVENPSGEFERSVKRRLEAEKCLLEWQAQQRLLRARHSKHRPCYSYVPGELVFYWRTQDSNKGRRQPGGKHGRFLGPARVLATESRCEASGEVRPGGAIWLVKGRSLLKCCPEQLRKASHREELVAAIASGHSQATPWTFNSVAEQIGGNKFEDLTGDTPDLQEWQRAQDADEEVQPSRYRLRHKRPASGPPSGVREDDEELPEASEAASSPQRPRLQGPSGENQAAWWNTIPEDHWPTQRAGYWDDQTAAVAIEIGFPESQRGKQRALQDLSGYFVSSMKRRAVELSEKRMTAAERAEFSSAKGIEVKNFVASQAFEILPDHLKPDSSQAISMRWILSWKLRDDGSRKAKARAVLLGYQDGSYEHRATTSPVMTRQTRQLLLQVAAWKRWRVQKGDVTGAFLQSRQYPDELYCIPCPEICEALGVPSGSVTRVRKACYGLVDAPLEWYRSVDQFLKELGFQRLWSDACCWVLREKGVLRGIISGHVDDFLFGGKEGDALWESKVEAIKAKFKWGDWEQDRFTQCGVIVEQTKQGFELSQPSYLEGLHEIGVNASRRKDLSQPTSDREKSQLRALLGGISWHAQQVAPYLAAEVGLLLTEVTKSSVDTIIRANQLLAVAKSKQQYRMKIHAFPEDQELVLIAWVDAAHANRIDGGSTQGIILGMSTSQLLEGKVQGVSPIGWHSQRIDRTCRSPGAAESQAAVNGEDHLHAARYAWSEMLYGDVNLSDPDGVVRRVRGCVVTDSRNVYDKLVTETLVIKGAEKRTSLELLALKEAQENTGVSVRWVHSEAQLANTLTKSGGFREYDLFNKMGHVWRLVEDEKMMSARRRKELGLQPLESEGKSNVSSQGDVCISE